MRLRVALAVLCGFGLRAQAGDRSDPPGVEQAPPPAHWNIPPAPVLSPDAALRSFAIQGGYRIELCASEPLVEDPVAVAFDADSRLWVVEMRGFMPDADGRGELEPSGRIVVLTDRDGDGRMDERTVFDDGLVLPRAVLPLRGGALVLVPPKFWFCRDTDGDGRADQRIDLGREFENGFDNPEHAANSPVLGLDNWIWFARYDQRLRFAGGTWQWQAVQPGGQWGLAQDAVGTLFFNTNSDHLRAHLAPPHYARRNPHLAAAAFADVQVGKSQEVWPGRVTPGVNRGYRKETLRDDGTLRAFTAVCGPCIYRGDLMPELLGDAFVAEPSANLVRRDLRERDGLGWRARNAYEQREFLTSTDERFRPVNVVDGPDGGLYVVDLYRGVLQHRVYMTTYLRRQVDERGLAAPVGLGRIWRIVPTSLPERRKVDWPRLANAPSAELLRTLGSRNGVVRGLAQQVLVERSRAGDRAALRRMTSGADAVASVHALWTLEGIDGVDRATLLGALRDARPAVRSVALRLCEPRLAGDPLLCQVAQELAADPDLGVRLQAALSLGAAPSASLDVLVDMLVRDAAEPCIVDAVLSGLAHLELAVIERLSSDGRFVVEAPGRARVLRRLASCVFRERDAARMARMCELAAMQGAPWRRDAMLHGIVDALPGQGARRLTVAGRSSAFARLVAEGNPLAARIDAAVEPVASGAAGPRPLTDEERVLFERGAVLYAQQCATCHQADGRGMGGLAPPLRDSEWVLGPAGRLVRIVLHGVTGPIDVKGQRYELAPMPDHGRLTDDEVAAVVTWVRRAWEHEVEPVGAAAVRAVRAAEAGRTEPWTAAELERY